MFLMWCGLAGTPSWAKRSHSILPVFRSRHSTFHWCVSLGGGYLLASTSSRYRPLRGSAVSPVLMQVVRKTRSPQTIGDDQPSPARRSSRGRSPSPTSARAAARRRCRGRAHGQKVRHVVGGLGDDARVGTAPETHGEGVSHQAGSMME